MKFTQIILLLAATLAFVGLAAGTWFPKKAEKVEETEFKVEIANPCVEEETDEACNKCCVNLGRLQTGIGRVRSGLMLEEWVNEHGHMKRYRACYCAPMNVYVHRDASWMAKY